MVFFSQCFISIGNIFDKRERSKVI